MSEYLKKLAAQGLYDRYSDAFYRWESTGDIKPLTYMLKELERFFEDIQDLPPLKLVQKILTKGDPYDFWDLEALKGLLHEMWSPSGDPWRDKILRLPQE
jgi:hypothetical protein